MDQSAEAWRAALAPLYEIGPFLGEGAAARVFAARDRKHDRDVAFKVLRPELVHESGTPRFGREMRMERNEEPDGEVHGYCFFFAR